MIRCLSRLCTFRFGRYTTTHRHTCSVACAGLAVLWPRICKPHGEDAPARRGSFVLLNRRKSCTWCLLDLIPCLHRRHPFRIQRAGKPTSDPRYHSPWSKLHKTPLDNMAEAITTSRFEYDPESEEPYIVLPGLPELRLTPLRKGDVEAQVRMYSDPSVGGWALRRPFP